MQNEPMMIARTAALCAVTVFVACGCLLGIRHGRRPWIWGIVGGYNVVLLVLYAGAVVFRGWGYIQLGLMVTLVVLTLPWSIVLNGPVNVALSAAPTIRNVIVAVDPGLFLFVGVFGGINSLGMYLLLRWALYGVRSRTRANERISPLGLSLGGRGQDADVRANGESRRPGPRD
jgi:hypothetical protein